MRRHSAVANARQHQIKQHQIDAALGEQFQTFLASGGGGHVVPSRRELVYQRLAIGFLSSTIRMRVIVAFLGYVPVRIGAKFSDIIVSICSPLACCFPKVRNCVIGYARCAHLAHCVIVWQWNGTMSGTNQGPTFVSTRPTGPRRHPHPGAAGSSMVNVDPLPVRDQTEIRPPFSCTQCLVDGRPSPEPPVSRERAGSTR